MEVDKQILSDFELTVEIGYELSQQFRGIVSKDRRLTVSTHILAKQIPNCISLLKIIPGSKYNKNNPVTDFYDFPSIASLARNLVEGSNVVYYLCIQEISREEEDFRFKVYDFHEIAELLLIVEQLQLEVIEFKKLKKELSEKRSKLEVDPVFQTLNKELKKLLITGKRGTHLTQFEIAKVRGVHFDHFKGLYKLMSVQTHSAPLSINHTVFTASQDNRNESNIPLIELILGYTTHFIADTVLSITDLWEFKFAKTESRKLLEAYSKQLIEY